ncbi:acyl carrier protein [candidate division KSB1 bacterium]
MKTQEKIIEIIKENITWENDISLDMHLTQDLGIDSLDMLMIVNTLEDEYSIEVEENCIKDLKTIGDVVEKLNELISVKV